jgi:hypothetical protein
MGLSSTAFYAALDGLLRAQYDAAGVKEFDPSEPRDELGRWTDGGGGGAPGSGAAAIALKR